MSDAKSNIISKYSNIITIQIITFFMSNGKVQTKNVLHWQWQVTNWQLFAVGRCFPTFFDQKISGEILLQPL